MAKQIMAIGVAMVMLLTGNLAWSDDCGIVNPSFEDDGAVNDIAAVAPTGWTADLLGGNFGGYIYTNWKTDGFYSLSLHLNSRVDYFAGDMATVSQAKPIDMSVVRQINFDVMLETGFGPWDPNVCTAVVLIDDDVVWESNSVGPDVRGVYRDQVYIIENKYRDEGLHTISLGMRMNVDWFYWIDEAYQTYWDMIDCNLYCGGAAPIEGDINNDCCVDGNDLKLLADMWLADAIDPNDPANLSHDGDELTSFATIDFYDFAVYAGGWAGDMLGLEGLAEYWLGIVDPDYEFNLFTEDDIRPSAEINFLDLAVLGNHWLECSFIEE